MTALPIGHVLVDLETDSRPARNARVLPEVPSAASKRADMESRVEEARVRGVAEGRAEERAEWEARLAEQATAFEGKLATERQRWASEEGERLGSLIASQLREMETRLGEAVARVLKPVLGQEVRRRALAELVELLDRLLSKGEVTRLSVSGPEDLVKIVRGQLEGKIAGASFVGNGACDVRITADETTFETRIEEWARAIAGEER
jgi:hypothetical protein